MASPNHPQDHSGGIFSLLDTDLYKLTMQCAILKYMPDINVSYAFTNRTPDMRLDRQAFEWLQAQVDKLASLSLTATELTFLRSYCPYLSESYLSFLSNFRLQPSSHVTLAFSPIRDGSGLGNLEIGIAGRWVDTILYEIPLLALTSEAYFRFVDRDWSYEAQQEQAYAKAIQLLSHGCVFSEFGTRRRRDYHTMELLLQGLTHAAAEAEHKGLSGKLSGTSNVHFAMRFNLAPVGTVAHEWFMGVASITDDYAHASETALRYWVGCFGEGVLGVALTDTFGTPVFLDAFKKAMPSIAETYDKQESITVLRPEALRPAISGNGAIDVELEMNVPDISDAAKDERPRTYAQTFTGTRQDSGDPLEFVKVMRKFYDDEGIKEKKTIVFSDSLNVEKCIKYREVAEEAGFSPTFGIGTFFTNDFTHVSNGKKSAPLNIVIKLSSASGRPAIKISDNIGKNTGDSATVDKVKKSLGYVEKDWVEGDESVRWGKDDEDVKV